MTTLLFTIVLDCNLRKLKQIVLAILAMDYEFRLALHFTLNDKSYVMYTVF